jgi:hypothetical protein
MLRKLLSSFTRRPAIPRRAKRYMGEWKPPTYTGPTIIGKAITASDTPDTPDGVIWLGKAIPDHPPLQARQ